MNSRFDNWLPIMKADFAFIVIFAVFSFLLLLVFLLTGIKLIRKPSGDTFGTVAEQEKGLLRLHRARFAVLMALSLISLVIRFSTAAANYNFFDIQTDFNLSTTTTAFWDIRNVFFSAVLIAVLDSGIKISQLRRYGSTANGMQGGTNVNIIVMSCIVGFIAILSIAHIAVTVELNAEYLAFEPDSITAPKWWAQFGLAQASNFFNVVLSIYYTIVTIVMRRKKRIIPHESNEADKNYRNGFRVLDVSHSRAIEVQILSAPAACCHTSMPFVTFVDGLHNHFDPNSKHNHSGPISKHTSNYSRSCLGSLVIFLCR
ncbi:hypothetical protein M378DRAFT_283964 [Amanita muscaria Koide BX008]|uniref:Uncharacterized protein n=1 Tax=Amanita muscaria (strain Koide BX008) TaxID=946122 RepID=A0A0C2WQP0_AMAMK|nr:hypothetical protein M378DRAFT_283964 [Amanita muscaria Koide BX008]